MLPRPNRVLTGDDFRQVFRSPVRRNAGWASFHLMIIDSNQPSQFGFIVGSLVGNAVMRNRTKRRLRALAADLLKKHSSGYKLVIRCNSQAGSLEFLDMKKSFDSLTHSMLGLPVGGDQDD